MKGRKADMIITIIGGVVVKIGDTRIDGSVIGRLQALKAELMASN